MQTGIGPVSVRIPKVRSRDGTPVSFRSALVPPYVRKTREEAALPWLYLKGISSGEMAPALNPYFPSGAPVGANVANPDASAHRFRPQPMPGCTGTPPSGTIRGHDTSRCLAGPFQRDGQTCPAGFVRCRTVSASCICWRRLKAADHSGDGTHHLAGDGDPANLKGMVRAWRTTRPWPHGAGIDPDEPGLKAGQRPVCHGPGRSMQRGNVAGLQTSACRCSRTPLWWNRLQGSRVRRKAWFPSLMCRPEYLKRVFS